MYDTEFYSIYMIMMNFKYFAIKYFLILTIIFCAIHMVYGKCPKILYTTLANKMASANSADPNQTAPEGAV